MQTGIIGLPQVGKTTLFRILTKAHVEGKAGASATHVGVASGNNQFSAVSSEVSAPVCAYALDAQENPVAGVRITFGQMTGGGAISGAVMPTPSSRAPT